MNERSCPSPGCPESMHVDHQTRVWRCPMHGPMELADEPHVVSEISQLWINGVKLS